MALALNAARQLTQVLFFKFAEDRARLTLAETQLGASTERLRSIASLVAEKVAPHLPENVGKIDI